MGLVVCSSELTTLGDGHSLISVPKMAEYSSFIKADYSNEFILGLAGNLARKV